ncbi:MAG: 4-(cytidine 5'-diphospho)-2-C-methyl-D-erythritol kinase [Eubacteriales bacterium]
MDEITIKAHAKVNLTLNLTGRRPDGYHLIETIMHQIPLHDTVRIRPSGDIAISSTVPWLDCGSSNTARKAAELFFAYTGLLSGAKIYIEKHIPVAAGLGGGSSDGAAVLRGLNELYSAGLDVTELSSLALRIGADAPFFIMGGCALCEGIGEVITPVESSLDLSGIRVAMPNRGVSTPLAYRLYDEQDTVPVPANTSSMLDAVRSGDKVRAARLLRNVFEDAILPSRPDIVRLKEDMLGQGALGASMSGSGAAVFGLF